MGDIFKLISDNAFWEGFLRGLAVPCEFFAVGMVPPPESPEDGLQADLDALRSDWLNIGADFRTVIEGADFRALIEGADSHSVIERDHGRTS